MAGKRTMSLKEACDFVPDDLPDGAYWAMAHDIAGADYGSVWGELKGKPTKLKEPHGEPKGSRCSVCQQPFASKQSMRQHRTAKHPEYQPQGAGSANNNNK